MSRSLPLCSRWLPASINIARALDTVKRYTVSAPVQFSTYGKRLAGRAGQLHRTCVEEEVAPSCLWVSSCPPSRPQHTKRPGLRFPVDEGSFRSPVLRAQVSSRRVAPQGPPPPYGLVPSTTARRSRS